MNRNEQKDLRKLAINVLRRLEYDGSCEYGTIGLDCKRPFGNSDVEPDILKIIGWEMEGDDGYEKCYSSEQREYARELYTEKLAKYMRTLQIAEGIV
jgi:hypothetical protein